MPATTGRTTGAADTSADRAATALPVTLQQRLDRLRVRARVTRLDWHDDALVIGLVARLHQADMTIRPRLRSGSLCWPRLMTDGIPAFKPGMEVLGPRDRVLADADATVTLVNRQADQEFDPGRLDVTAEPAGGADASGEDGAATELQAAGEVTLPLADLAARPAGMWGVRVSMTFAGLTRRSHPRLAYNLDGVGVGRPAHAGGPSVAPYVTKVGMLAVAIGRPAPAAPRELSFDLLHGVAARAGDRLELRMRVPNLGRASGLVFGLRHGQRDVHGTGSCDEDGNVTASFPAHPLTGASWRLWLDPGGGRPRTAVDATVVVPARGPVALLAGPPTPPSQVHSAHARAGR